jgi:hypothetical protein
MLSSPTTAAYYISGLPYPSNAFFRFQQCYYLQPFTSHHRSLTNSLSILIVSAAATRASRIRAWSDNILLEPQFRSLACFKLILHFPATCSCLAPTDWSLRKRGSTHNSVKLYMVLLHRRGLLRAEFTSAPDIVLLKCKHVGLNTTTGPICPKTDNLLCRVVCIYTFYYTIHYT